MNTSVKQNIMQEVDATYGLRNAQDIIVLASPYAGSARVLYLLLPVTVTLPTLQKWSREYKCNIVAISGFDWNNDMTPWSAPSVAVTEPPFMGNAELFLHALTERIIPVAEEAMGLDGKVERTICGISLSGLFALWAWMTDSHFSNVGSISGSFWYDGLLDWVDSHLIHKTGKARFLVGDLEGGTNGNARFANIQEETRHLVSSLSDAGNDVKLEKNHGNHFAPVDPRVEELLDMLYA